MCEVMNATVPYYEIGSNKKLVTKICEGLRLQKPTKIPVPNELWTLMQSCWLEPDQRPTFQQIYDQLTLLLNEEANSNIRTSPPSESDSSNLSQLVTSPSQTPTPTSFYLHSPSLKTD
jgi:hypothetical protein